MLRPETDSARPVAAPVRARETRHPSERPHTHVVPDDAIEATVPLSVLVAPSCSAVIAGVSDVLRKTPAALVSANPPLNEVDPRLAADLVILDVSQLDAARDVCLRAARTRWPSALIICLNVATEALASQLLDVGADIALRADVSGEYVRGILSAAGRRLNHAHAELRITFGDLVFDKEAHRVWCAGVPVALTERELRLFQHLLLHAGRIVSQAALAASAWRVDPTISSNGLAVYIGYLRRKLARSRLTELVTVRGEGYGLRLRSDQ